MAAPPLRRCGFTRKTPSENPLVLGLSSTPGHDIVSEEAGVDSTSASASALCV